MKTPQSQAWSRLLLRSMGDEKAEAVDWPALDADQEDLFKRITKQASPKVPKDTLSRLRFRIQSEKKFREKAAPVLERHAKAVARQIVANGETPGKEFRDAQVKYLQDALRPLLEQQGRDGVRRAVLTVEQMKKIDLYEVALGAVKWAAGRAAELASSLFQTSWDLAKRAWNSIRGKKPTAGKESIPEVAEAVAPPARIDSIAATEVANTHEATSRLVWDDAGAVGTLWWTFGDEKVCPVCSPLDEVEIPIGGKFVSGDWEGDGPPVHPSCRCVSTPVFD